jgi:glycosyltransferase involved in cell wall biosynthesis
MKQAIHITHEAAKKIGGIGSVLSGMCTAKTYLDNFDRTIFYGPLFDDTPNPDFLENIAIERLGGNAKILYSSLDRIFSSKYDSLFHALCQKYSIEIVYGEKKLYDEIDPNKNNQIEILLIGINNIDATSENEFKFLMWEKFQFSCQLFEGDWDFEQYLRIAVPFREITSAILDAKAKTVYFSHEYMGIASCLAIHLQKTAKESIYFHAHEISTARAVTEKIPGHDVTFYHLIDGDMKSGMALEERFGNQKHNSRNELLKLTLVFDGVLAVGDWVKKEYKYLLKNSVDKKIHITYNGIPTPDYTYEDKKQARVKIQEYCETLYNFTPDIIMTHVTRLVISKGLWRDISLLEELDKKFTTDKVKGFCIILSTLIGNGRNTSDITQMEADYGWPVLHKEGYPDLLGYENDIYWSCQYFNAKSRSIKVLFINQFGFNPYRIGNRLPKNTNFADLRLSSDAEFGMSVYEPFGIAQIETIPFGGVAILTRACGSAFLLESTFADEKTKPFFVFDFAENTKANKDVDWLSLSSQDREVIEKEIIKKNIDEVYKVLPKNDKQRQAVFNVCKKHLDKLSWTEVIKSMPFFK